MHDERCVHVDCRVFGRARDAGATLKPVYKVWNAMWERSGYLSTRTFRHDRIDILPYDCRSSSWSEHELDMPPASRNGFRLYCQPATYISCPRRAHSYARWRHRHAQISDADTHWESSSMYKGKFKLTLLALLLGRYSDYQSQEMRGHLSRIMLV